MKNLFIGIDFAAKKFDVAVIYAEGLQEQAPAEYNQFENTDEGFKAFVSWVKKNSHKTKAQDWLFCCKIRHLKCFKRMKQLFQAHETVVSSV